MTSSRTGRRRAGTGAPARRCWRGRSPGGSSPGSFSEPCCSSPSRSGTWSSGSAAARSERQGVEEFGKGAPGREVTMRKVTYGGAVSLDHYLAGPGEAIDWLRWSDDAARIGAESFRGVDAMLMGRKTYEFAQRMGGGPAAIGETPYVSSRTLEAVPEGAGVLVREEAADFVRRLKGQPGGDILVMGGGEIGTALIAAGLVDEIRLSVHPVLLGGGTPAFGAFGRRVELELIEARAIARECVLLRYKAG